MYRLEVHPQFILLQGPTQFSGGLDPMLCMGGQLFGVQRIAGPPVAFGLVQRRVGIAQQLLGTQGIAGVKADSDAGADEQTVALELKRLTHTLDDALRQLARLADLLAVLDQHAEFVAAQTRKGHTVTQHLPQTLAHQLQQLVANGMAQAVVYALEVIQVQQQQGATALVGLRRRQCLLHPVGKQQAVGQASQRVVVGQIGKFLFRMLDGADVTEHRHVMAELTFVVANGANSLPLRVDLAAFAPIPDFTAPLALLGQGGENLLVEGQAMVAGLELARALADDLILLVAGDAHEGTIDVHDQALAVGHQHTFEGTVEHRGSHAQPFTVFTTQTRAMADEIEQAHARHIDQQGTEQHPDHHVDLPPHGQCQGIVSHAVQHHLRQRKPEDREHHI